MAAVLLLALFCAQSAWGATCSSIVSGSWSNSSTWTYSWPLSWITCHGDIPHDNDDIVVSHNVVVDANTAELNDVTINDGGVLRWDSGTGTLQLDGDFTNNGVFTAGSGTVVFTGSSQSLASRTGSITFNNLNLGSTQLNLSTNVIVTGTLSGTVNLVSTCDSGVNYTITTPTATYNTCEACNDAGSGIGLYGRYYNTGGGAAPAFPTSTTPDLLRLDSQVNFDWGSGSPGTGVNADGFVVRWEGVLRANSAGTYRFRTYTDDGVRLWVNNTQVINDWNDHAASNNTSVGITLGVCQSVPIAMEFYENGGQAVAQLQWQPPGTSSYVTVPQGNLYAAVPTVSSAQVGDCNYSAIIVKFSQAMQNTTDTYGIRNPANYVVKNGGATVAVNSVTSSDGVTAQLNLATPLSASAGTTVTVSNVKDANGIPMAVSSTLAVEVNSSGFFARYYNWSGGTPPYNPSGTPALTRTDTTIDFNWGTGSPDASAVHADRFQGYWVGTVTIPSTGYYTFYATSDDGQMLYANGTLLINDWGLHSATERTSTPQYYTVGQTVQLEYAMYENEVDAVARLYWRAGTNSNNSNIFAKQPVSGVSATCPVIVTPPSNFNAFDTATVANSTDGVIKTKIAGAAFTVDVVALTETSTLKTDFEGDVKVELVDGSGTTACGSRTAISAVHTLPFVVANAGRQSTSFTENNAWSNVRVRMTHVTSTGGTIVACSTDAFAIRPNVLAVSVTDADWETAGTSRTLNNVTVSGGMVHKAGRPFTITATAYNAAATPAITGNYNGGPTAQITAYVLPTACASCALSNVAFNGSGGTVVSSTNTYNEVGVFALQLQDDQFAVVDATDGSTVAERIIVSDEVMVGRFVPDHFALTNGAVAPACATGFTYMSQPAIGVSYTLQAQNYANGVTVNYTTTSTDNLAQGAVTVVAENNDAGTDLAGRLTFSGTVPSWSAGVFTLNSTTVSFNRGAAPDGPYDALQLGVNVADADGVTLSAMDMNAGTSGACGSACNNKAIGSPTSVRFGRLRLMNAYGSERLNLPVPIIAQHYSAATNSFVSNTLDNCTQIFAGNVVLSGYTGNLTAANLAIGGSFANGIGSLTLNSGGVTGSVNLCVDLGADVIPGPICNATLANMPWLQGRWTGASHDDDPFMTATFGIHKKANEFIYLREMY